MDKKIVFLMFLIILIVAAITIFFIVKNNQANNAIQNFSNINMSDEININQITNNIDDINDSIKRKGNMVLYIKVNNKILTVTLENNSSVDGLLKKLEEQDIIIDMEDYANFEKVGTLEFSLPRNDKQITTKAGDIILYQGNQFVIYYDTNSWNFTKLGHIENITQEELKEILGVGDVTVTLTLKQ